MPKKKKNKSLRNVFSENVIKILSKVKGRWELEVKSAKSEAHYNSFQSVIGLWVRNREKGILFKKLKNYINAIEQIF